MSLLLHLVLLLAQTISGTVTLSGDITCGGGTQVATPTMSQAAGALAPGTATTPSDSTGGATIFYTVDGSTPTYTSASNGYLYPTGTAMEFRSGDYASGFAIYGAKTFKLLAAEAGLSDSAVASYAYTLSAPSGTALSACGTLSASTNYYLTQSVSATGTCLASGGNSWTLNLNGYTVTYGTGQTALVASTAGVTNGTTTVSVSSGTPFATCPTGDTIAIDDGSQNTKQTTVSSCPTSSSVIVASAPGWSSSGNNVHVWAGSAVYGILCSGTAAAGCLNAKIYNGTITQSSDINPLSNAIQLGSYSQDPDNGTNVVSDVAINVNSQDVQAINIQASLSTYGLGDLIQFNTIDDTSTVISNRDQFLGTPIIAFESSHSSVTSPVDTFNDNTVIQSPQGSIQSQVTANVFNNHLNAGMVVQYVGGYGVFLNSAGSVARGNNVSGWQRGLESECTSATVGCTFDQNVVNTIDSALVHDPNHNPLQCEIGGNDGFRVKDYNTVGVIGYVNTLVENNLITTTADACPAQGIRFSQMNCASGSVGNDSGTIQNNIVSLVMDADTQSVTTPSGAWSADSGGATNQQCMGGYTFTSNADSVSGAFATDGFDVSIDLGGATSWTQGNLATPAIWYGGEGVGPSSGTFTGSGTQVLTCTTSGSASTFAGTYNAVSIHCP